MKQAIILIVAISALMFSCSNDTDSPLVEKPKQGIKFSSSVTGDKLKSTDSWKAGDEIYILMKKVGENTGEYADWFPYNQAPATYVTIYGDGMFTPKTPQDELFFPENGDAVHFIAYAPHAPVVDENEDLTVPVALPSSNGTLMAGILDATIFYQEDQSKIDIIFAKNLTDKTKDDDNTVQLEFDHMMSKLVFNISTEGDLTETDLTGLKVYAKDLFTAGRFYMAYNNVNWTFASRTIPEPPVYFKVSAEGKSAEATLLPYRLASSDPSDPMKRKIIFELTNGEEYQWDFDINKLVQGVKNTYNIILKKSNVKVALEEGQATVTDWANNPIEDVTLE
jgi:hypothetical protein